MKKSNNMVDTLAKIANGWIHLIELSEEMGLFDEKDTLDSNLEKIGEGISDMAKLLGIEEIEND